MAFQASKLEMAYNMQKLVPPSDNEYIFYENFKNEYGEDGNKLIIGFKSDSIFSLNFYNELNALCRDIEKVNGVTEALSIANILNLTKNDSIHQFELKPLIGDKVKAENLDSLKKTVLGLRFYKKLIYNPDSNAALIIVSIDKKKLDTKDRITIINQIHDLTEKFGNKVHTEMKYSGLPYVRHVMATQVKDELVFFTFLALATTALLLLLFFRSFTNIIIPLLIVSFSVIWSVGWIGIFNYKITILTGLIPAIMIVIGIPNCIYLINKYHDEFRKHGNKIKSLQRVISKVGIATVLTNSTTAIGFGVFYFTDTLMLKQFGVVAFLSVTSIFIISLLLIPIIYSFLPAPSVKQTKHMDNKSMNTFVNWIHNMVFNKRRRIYFFTIAIIIISVFGFIKLKPLVYMVDDIPHHNKLYQDLLFIQANFKGVMPFEIIIDTGERDGIKNPTTLQKIYKLQKNLENHPEFSRAVSIVEVISFANQSYHDGDEKYYRLPNNLDFTEIAGYMPSNKNSDKNILNSLVDKEFQKARISIQMADIGSENMKNLTAEVRKTMDEIFPKEDYKCTITGTSIIFLKGNEYLLSSLGQSIVLAFVIIALLMGLMFTSFKMIIVSLIPNAIPLLITCGIMGFLGIPLKPSTILVFSIALGIAVDDTIHFLTKFRHELKYSGKTVTEVLSISVKEMGQSMIYTSVILFFGFIIFTFSNFQGTVSLGFLTAITLLVALFSNLFVLPALILSFEKNINPKEELEDSIIEDDINDNE